MVLLFQRFSIKKENGRKNLHDGYQNLSGKKTLVYIFQNDKFLCPHKKRFSTFWLITNENGFLIPDIISRQNGEIS
jgi:hypothetical protein